MWRGVIEVACDLSNLVQDKGQAQADSLLLLRAPRGNMRGRKEQGDILS